MKKFGKIVVLLLAAVMVGTSLLTLAACKEPLDNESTRLVMSIGELDGVFNPFFSTSATDSSVIGMTQISMLSSDKDGNVAYGENEPSVVLDYGVQTTLKSGHEGETPNVDNATTTYTFVLKSGLKFSNGSPLTMKDVLFNLYVYLDPAYTGSATVYSSEIVGMAEYRTQTSNINEQEIFQSTYEAEAYDRIEFLAACLTEIYDDMKISQEKVTEDSVKAHLQQIVDEYREFADNETDEEQKKEWLKHTTLIEDYERIDKLFRKELDTDWNLAKGTAEEIKFDEDRVHLNTDTEAFLYNEGFITWVEEKDGIAGHLEYSFGEASKNWDEQTAKNAVYSSYFPGNVVPVLLGSASTDTLVAEFTAIAKKDYFDSLDEEDKVKNISGIVFANKDQPVTFTNATGDTKEYAVPIYNSDGSVQDGNEVLQITIKGIDPKAIWNFGVTVAPMYYYSTDNWGGNPGKRYISDFDYEENFGVEFGDVDFMNEVVNDPEKIGVPVGAGPYKATTVDGRSDQVTAGSFYSDNVVHYERNDNFMFPVNIRYVNYKVVDPKTMITSLTNNEIHIAEPNCDDKNVKEMQKYQRKGYEYKTVMTNGYGYIGINAGKVPTLEVRQAIMYAIDTELCLGYYPGYSQRINRPMTRAYAWAYPTQTDVGPNGETGNQSQYYPYDGSGETSENLVKAAGYFKGSDGIYVDNKGNKLEYTFTIAGDSEDHPAFQALYNAMTILNKRGFKIKVKKDLNALKKLNTGELTVWAAAWGGGIDPDMYQVYHMDSQATSTNNWGYREIKRNNGRNYPKEYEILVNLSQLIDEARETEDRTIRAGIYAQALDKVMELAVELPTYQRSDMFAYNTKVIDVSTMTPSDELTPFNGPFNRLWEVSFVGQSK